MKRRIIALALACCAFVLTLGLAACGGGGSAASSSGSESAESSAASGASASASSSAEDQAEAEYNRACALFDEGKYYSAKVAFEESAYKDWEQRAAACVQAMPATGELFHDEGLVSDEMGLNFVVNEEDENFGRYISVYTKDNKLAETLFVKGTGTVETWLPGGEYYVKCSMGTEWYGTDEQFGPDGYYESMVFDEVEGDRYLTVLDAGYIWDISINSGSDTGQGVGSEEVDWNNR